MTFLRYVAQGLVNAALTFLIYIVLLRWLPYYAAYTIAFVAGIMFSYLVNRSFVFRAQGSGRAVAYFIAVYLVLYVVGLTATTLLQPVIGAEAAIGGALVVTVPTSYLLTRWIFART